MLENVCYESLVQTGDSVSLDSEFRYYEALN